MKLIKFFSSSLRCPLLFLLVLLIFIGSKSLQAQEAYTSDAAIDARVTKIMEGMEIVDKVGEMTQLAIDMVSIGNPYSLKEPHQLDTEKLKNVLADLRVGSILNCGGHAYSRDHWNEIITTIQDYAVNKKPTKIPVIFGIDAIHGVNFTQGATLYPQQIGLAATWNPILVESLGRITAYECKASGIPWNFSPVLDMGRDPRWSRQWEGFGEDVYLAMQMGSAMIKGYQGDNIADDNSVAACMKHFVGYSVPWSGKDRAPAHIPERDLREYYLPTFQAAVDAGAATVMINSGEVNGIPTHANPKVLIDLLRNELGFKGLAVSDWEDIIFLHSRHRIANNYKEAIKIAINAGIDLSMVPIDTQYPILLRELVEEGEVPMSRIDEAVRRILTLKVKLGLFEQPVPNPANYPNFGSQQHADQARAAAQEAIILAKNEKQILPLAKTAKILVTGPTADRLPSLNGGWTNTWQGRDPKWHTAGKLTIRQALEKAGNAVQYVEGVRITEPANNQLVDKDINIAEAVAAAKNSDVAVICLGELSYTEVAGGLDDMELSDVQFKLVREVAATGTPVVLVLAEGRPRVFSKVEELADGIIVSFYPGNEGGLALADIIFGDVSPSAKFPITYPRFPNTLLTYDYKGTDRIGNSFGPDAINPQFEFGHGLSFTNFDYSNLQLSTDQLTANGTLEITVQVKNKGTRQGKEVVQLYIRDEVASITPAEKRLRGFEKIDLAPGESKTVTFSIQSKDLAFVGVDMNWVAEAGDFTVMIDGLKKGFILQ